MLEALGPSVGCCLLVPDVSTLALWAMSQGQYYSSTPGNPGRANRDHPHLPGRITCTRLQANLVGLTLWESPVSSGVIQSGLREWGYLWSGPVGEPVGVSCEAVGQSSVVAHPGRPRTSPVSAPPAEQSLILDTS